MGWTSAATITNYVVVEGANDGIFVYDGTAGAGTLIESDVAPGAAGTDPYGNSYLGGHTFYGHTASQIVASQWTPTSTGFPMFATFTGPTSGAGPWTAAGSLVFNGANEWEFLDQSGNTLLVIQEAQLIAGPHLKSTDPGTNNAETWHQATGLPAGFTGSVNYEMLAIGRVALSVDLSIASGTSITHGEAIAVLPAGYYSTLTGKFIQLTLENNGTYTSVPMQVTTTGNLAWMGAAVTTSGTSALAGEATIALDI